jgi:hypothetical protein
MARLLVAARLAAKSPLTMVVMLMVFPSRFAQHGRDAAFSEASLRVPSHGDRSPIAPTPVGRWGIWRSSVGQAVSSHRSPSSGTGGARDANQSSANSPTRLPTSAAAWSGHRSAAPSESTSDDVLQQRSVTVADAPLGVRSASGSADVRRSALAVLSAICVGPRMSWAARGQRHRAFERGARVCRRIDVVVGRCDRRSDGVRVVTSLRSSHRAERVVCTVHRDGRPANP